MAVQLKVMLEINGMNMLVGRLVGENSADAEFKYEQEYLQNPQARAISVSLPLQENSFSNIQTRTFFDGLLPEGYTRRCVAAEMRVAADDYISILQNLGKECLGAIQIIDDDETSDMSYLKMSLEKLHLFAKEGAVESANLVTKSHLSLTGASGKAGLYFEESSKEWFLPVGSAPSTHIVKQSHVRLNQIVTNEQLCLLTAQKLGIDIPESFIITFDDVDDGNVLFATKRYDRKESRRMINNLNIPYRLHQEDFSQALGIPAEKKYEKSDENYLKSMMNLLKQYASNPMQDQLALWRITVFNYLIGNTDNHIKNVSLLYSEDMTQINLAPAYDIICTLIYESSTDEMGIRINGKTEINDISRSDFEAEAKKCGLGTAIFMKEYDRLAGLLDQSLEEASLELSRKGFTSAGKIKDLIVENRRNRGLSK